MSKERIKCCDNCKWFNPSEGSKVEGNGTEWIECDVMYVESQTYLNTKTFYCSFFKVKQELRGD